MSVQFIIDTGQIPSGEPTAVLEEALAKVDQLIWYFKKTETWGEAGKAVLEQYQDLETRLQDAINKRRGVDGMTPLSS